MKKVKFNIGDGVQLLSGSPHMTVIGQTKDGQVNCCWFDGDQKERRSKFPGAALVPERVEELTDDELNRRLSKLREKRKSDYSSSRIAVGVTTR